MKTPTALIAALLLSLLSTPAPAELNFPRLDAAVDRGLAYLAQQQHEDGSFDVDLKTGGGDGLKPKMAITGLVLLTFLAEGQTPDSGRYGTTVRQALDYLASKVPEDGYAGNLDGSRMYGQAIVTLALAEAMGVEPVVEKRSRERAALERLVAAILKAQAVNKPDVYAGGWRYEPGAGDSDISLSGWNALALRAAQEAGVEVPADSFRRAASFVSRCYEPSTRTFAYQPGGERRLGATGAGVLSLLLLPCDPSDREKAARAARELRDHPVDAQNAYPFYTIYYVTHAGYAAGEEVWEPIAKVTIDLLIKSQSSDGSWQELSGSAPNGNEPGRVYRTAMALLTLSVPQHVLPIYQR